MDKGQGTALPAEDTAAFRPAQEDLVQTRVRLRVWDCHVDTLPERLTSECKSIGLAHRLYYPYWCLNLDVTVKSFFLPPRRIELRPSVDAVTGQPCMVMAGERPLVIDGADLPTYIVPTAVTMDDVGNERVYQAMNALVGKRLRSWSNTHLRIRGGSLVRKRIDLYAATLKSGAALLVALDTVSGDYGIVDAVA